MLNAELHFGADLSVIRCENWTRNQFFEQTGLPWINLSPSMRSPAEAALYPGTCLVEGTSLSVGRGTLKPFEQVGAPYVDGEKLAAELNRAGLPGVRFESVRFTPIPALYPGPGSLLKLSGQECGGVRIHVTDRTRCAVVDVGITLALTVQRLYPEKFDATKMAACVGDDATVAAIKAGQSLAEIKALWAAGLVRYEQRRKNFLLYR
jgi:uncharacterized protein YbbC (DUF1343 family)